ncbi:MAG TPA: YdcF family protein [Steroidobacteraceae bacterium]|nr:YdcF family protein [Steroidobacteraceae bacterium]
MHPSFESPSPLIHLLQLKTFLKNALLPPGGFLLLALIGLLLLKRRPALARACLIASFASLWLLSTPVISDLLTGWVERYPPLDLKGAADAQAIVILGGGGQRALAPEYGGPAAEPLMLERLSYGAYLAKKTGLPVLVTGFSLEARAMHDSLQRNFGVETHWIDDQAYDTFQNARNTAQLLQADGVRRIILVTRATHMGRSVEEFTSAGFEVRPAPAGMVAPQDFGVLRFVPNPDALLRSHAAIYEMVGEPVRLFLAATHLRRQ